MILKERKFNSLIPELSVEYSSGNLNGGIEVTDWVENDETVDGAMGY